MFVQLVALISPILLDKSQAAMRRGLGRGVIKGPAFFLSQGLELSLPFPREPRQRRESRRQGVVLPDVQPGVQLLIPRGCPERALASGRSSPNSPSLRKLARLAPTSG